MSGGGETARGLGRKDEKKVIPYYFTYDGDAPPHYFFVHQVFKVNPENPGQWIAVPRGELPALRYQESGGASRVTTWAYKFGLLEAGVRLRRRAWQEREVVVEPEVWPLMADAGQSPEDQAETSELLAVITDSIDGCLTGHQREVLVALALNGVPLDVLADRLGTTRGALYKTLHDARRKLRADLAKRGFTLDSI